MKTLISLLTLSAFLTAVGILSAGELIPPSSEAAPPITCVSDQCETTNLWECDRPDSHAPIGVMGDHTHHAGGLMLSYRFMYMEMDGQRTGTDDLSSGDVFDLGYMVSPTGMKMEMHMFGLMFAPTDWLTLMAMANYQVRSMDHLTRPGSMARMLRGETSREKVNGWGDLTLGGLWKVYDGNSQRVHLNLGLSIPVGEFNARAYPMQPTTGTWDLIPGVTWLWQAGNLSGGAQAMARFHLGENEYDYTYGNSVDGTGWLAYRLCDWASISGRLSLEWEDRVRGEDSRIRGARMAPPMDPQNHGGTWLEGAVGLNILVPDGFLKGHRFAFEALWPMYQNLNGPQMKRDWTIVAGWKKGF